jgi:RNA polymerase sigma-70 factor (ECF subfamily)
LRDELLTSGLVRRDKVVFDYIFNYYYSSLCAFSMQYLNDRNAVEDLVQDFFVSLWTEAPNHQIHSSLKSYLFSSIKNRCLDYQKHIRVVQRYKSFMLFSTGDSDNSTDNFLAESELRHAMENSFEKIPARCREIFEMSRVKGFTNNEIAAHLGLSKRTVELQISNAIRILRKELVEYLPLFIFGLLVIRESSL